jgi:hypothetical protein
LQTLDDGAFDEAVALQCAQGSRQHALGQSVNFAPEIVKTAPSGTERDDDPAIPLEPNILKDTKDFFRRI